MDQAKAAASGGINKRRRPRRAFLGRVGKLFSGVYEIDLGSQIGEDGMLFFAAEKLPVGRHCILSITIPEFGSLVVRAEILYHVPSPEEGAAADMQGHGCKFVNHSIQIKRLVRSFVASKSKSEADAELAMMAFDQSKVG